jgi:hypothetical protein
MGWRRRRLTNKQIVEILLPIVREAVNRKVEFDRKDAYGNPCHREYREYQAGVHAGLIEVEWTDYGDHIQVAARMNLLDGRYDHATLATDIRKADGFVLEYLGFAKEFRGMSNGYYATVDWTGRILNSEWD